MVSAAKLRAVRCTQRKLPLSARATADTHCLTIPYPPDNPALGQTGRQQSNQHLCDRSDAYRSLCGSFRVLAVLRGYRLSATCTESFILRADWELAAESPHDEIISLSFDSPRLAVPTAAGERAGKAARNSYVLSLVQRITHCWIRKQLYIVYGN